MGLAPIIKSYVYEGPIKVEIIQKPNDSIEIIFRRLDVGNKNYSFFDLFTIDTNKDKIYSMTVTHGGFLYSLEKESFVKYEYLCQNVTLSIQDCINAKNDDFVEYKSYTLHIVI